MEWNQKITREGIIKKLNTSKRLIESDKEVSAGLYIYAIEEFGKLLLLDNSNCRDGRGIIKYRDEYVNHEIKFSRAFDYLQERDYVNCILLNDEGDFDPKSFWWRVSRFYNWFTAKYRSKTFNVLCRSQL